MKKEYKLTLCFFAIVAIFVLFGVISFRETEKVSEMHALVEKHGSTALTFLEAARKSVLDIRVFEGHLIEAKVEKSIDNNTRSIIDTYKTASGEIQLFRDYSRNEQKEENMKKILTHLEGLKKFSDELISLKLHSPSPIEDMNSVYKDGERKFNQLQDAIDDTLKLEYNTVFENFKNAAGLFENLKYKLLSLFITLTALSTILTYIMIFYFSGAFNELDTRLETEKVKAKLIELFDGEYNTTDAERLLYIVSKGLGAHASRLFEKKTSAHSNNVSYEKIGTYINAESKMDVRDINAFHDFKFFLGNTNVINDLILCDLEATTGKIDLVKEADPAPKTNFIDYIKKYEIKTFLACPMMKGNNHKYLMSFYFKEDITYFTEERIKSILELVGSVAVYLDNKDLLNEMAKKNELLNTQNNELEAFAHTVSHDLKTPLSGLRGFLELSKSELSKIDAEKKNEKLWNYLDIETKAALKMDALINDILALSKANNAALKIEKLDMKNVIEANLRSQENSIRDKNITVNVQKDIPDIDADQGSISRVWSNLISNSIKYMGDGERKEISISYAKVDGEHIFIYSDTGIGISRRYQSNIFTPFFRTHEAKSVEGTGVGLSIVKKIIERHRGTITFESAAGEGTTFYIRIPEDLSALKASKFREKNGNHK